MVAHHSCAMQLALRVLHRKLRVQLVIRTIQATVAYVLAHNMIVNIDRRCGATVARKS